MGADDEKLRARIQQISLSLQSGQMALNRRDKTKRVDWCRRAATHHFTQLLRLLVKVYSKNDSQPKQ